MSGAVIELRTLVKPDLNGDVWVLGHRPTAGSRAGHRAGRGLGKGKTTLLETDGRPAAASRGRSAAIRRTALFPEEGSNRPPVDAGLACCFSKGAYSPR